jgi:hypothetical protein
VLQDTLNFFLDSWNSRNQIKHDNNGDPNLQSKKKIFEKIIWSRERIKIKNDIAWLKLTREEVLELPMENLKMMDNQIKIFKCK